MNTLSALLFDVDGTLAETERDGHRVAFNQAFQQLDLNWDWTVPLYGDLLKVTGGKERIRYYLQHYLPQEAALFDTAFISKLHRLKTDIYVDLLDQGKIPLRSGVARLLKEAMTKHLRLAIATTTSYDNVAALLRNTLGEESIGWFEVIGAGDIVGAKKPAPDIYHYVLDQLKLTAKQCIVLEDSNNGLKSAKGAGLATVISLSFYTQAEDFKGADLVVDDLGEPQQAMQVVAGQLPGYTYINVAALCQVHLSS